MNRIKYWLRSLVVIAAVAFGFWLLPDAPDAQIVGPFVQSTCNQIINVSATASTSNVLTGTPGKVIYYCGFQMTSTAASTFSIGYSTNGTCASGVTSFTGTLNVGTTPTTDHLQYAFFNIPQIQPFLTATQNNLCFTAGAVAVSGNIYVGQY